jgi:ACS family hexuronate transporter-like MFS transporter
MNSSPNQTYRWWVVTLLFGASLLNYIDRVSLSVVAPQIRSTLKLSHTEYALILNAFLIVYAVVSAFGGPIIDRFGSNKSYMYSLICWSIANALHSIANSLGQICFFRALLGMGEAFFYPTGIKTISEWFRPADRTKAVAFLLLGMSAGITVAPPLIGLLSYHWGWRAMFFMTGISGLLLVPFWLLVHRKASCLIDPAESVNGSESPLLQRVPATQIPTNETLSILKNPSLWVLILARGLGDSAWYFYIFWLPDYLVSNRGYDLLKLSQFGWVPFVVADWGAWSGGWVSSRFIWEGWEVERSRKWVLAAAAALPPAGILAVMTGNPFVSLGLISLAMFGIMAYGTIIMTLPADLFPQQQVGTVAGLAGSAGSLAGAGFQLLAGWLIDQFSYTPVFFLAGIMHPLAALLIWKAIRWKPHTGLDLH